MADFTPRPYQEHIIQHIVNTRRCAVHASMGTGKTAATLFAISVVMLMEPCKVLVLGPLRVVASVWQQEAEKWDNLRHLRFAHIIGKAEDRALALRADADIYLMNYDNLVWLVKIWGDRWPFNWVIADESTRLKSVRTRQGGIRTKFFSRALFTKHRMSTGAALNDRFTELTGTPAPNGLLDLWGQYWFLDRGAALGNTYTAFKNRWFYSLPGAYAFGPVKPFGHSQAEITERIAPITISIQAKDWFPDLKVPIVREIPVALRDSAMKKYKQMEKQMFLEIDGHEVDALNAASKTIKCLQIANGAIYTDSDGSYSAIHSAKIEALESIISEAAGMPVLVAYHFKSDLKRLQSAFPHAKTLSNAEIIPEWNRGEIPILFAHPASAGHGLNLQDGGNIIVFFSHWWDLEQRDQILERIGPVRQLQSGHNRPVYVYNIVATGTLDSTVLLRHETKREVQELLLEARSRKPEKTL